MEPNPVPLKSHPKFKYILRSLVLYREDNKVLSKVRMKGLHLKEVLEITEDDGDELLFRLMKHKYLKGKLIKGLRKVELEFFNGLHWLNDLKTARSLRKVNMNIGMSDLHLVSGFPNTYSKADYIIRYLGKLSKDIEMMNISIEGLCVKKGNLAKFYRTLASYRKMTSCERMIGLQQFESYVKKELGLINRYFPKLHNLKDFTYDYWRYEKSCWEDEEFIEFPDGVDIDQVDFQNSVADSKTPYPSITNHSVNIVGEYLKTFNGFEMFLQEEKSDKGDGDTDGDGEWVDEDEEDSEEGNHQQGQGMNHNQGLSEEQRLQAMRQELLPFYRFELFPNLKILTLQIFEDCLYPLESFVVEAFSSLKKLEQVRVILEERPHGTKFIFEGLMELPLLEYFSLETPFLYDEDWELLGSFFQKQCELVSIKFLISKKRSTKKGYIKQNNHLENFYQYLEDKPKLRYLSLKSEYCPLESLSIALGKTKMENQLRFLSIEALDEPRPFRSNRAPAASRVEGLCDFIRRQRKSLYYLEFSLPFVIDIDMLGDFLLAVADLEEVRELELYINDVEESERSHYIKFFHQTLREDIPAVKDRRKNYNSLYPYLAHMLKEIKRVDDLTMYFGPNKLEEKHVNDFVEALKVLPTKRHLVNLELNIPFERVPGEQVKEIIKVFYDLKDISSILLQSDEIEDDDIVNEIEEAVDEVNQRQYLRCDLMF